MPSIEAVKDLLKTHWGVRPESVRPWPKSARILEVDGYGFSRVGFARGGLSAPELVEAMHHLRTSGCGVAYLIPTQKGDLSVPLPGAVLSLEERLPGDECSGANLDILDRVGGELGRIHGALYRSHLLPGCIRGLGEWIDETIAKALSWTATYGHADEIRELQDALTDADRRLTARFGLTHGDVRAPNVVTDGERFGFVDFCSEFGPQLSDVATMRNKWLMNGDTRYEGPLKPEEIMTVLRGYHEARSLTDDEAMAFPVIWAVSQAWRLIQDVRITSMFDGDRARLWPVSEQLAGLVSAKQDAQDMVDGSFER